MSASSSARIVGLAALIMSSLPHDATAALDRREPHDLAVAAGARGHVAVAWARNSRVGVAVRNPSGRVSGPWYLRERGDAFVSELAVNGRGDVVVAWVVNDETTEGDSASEGCCNRLRVAVRRVRKRLSRATTVSAPGIHAVDVALDLSSTAAALAWSSGVGSTAEHAVFVATGRSGRPFGAPRSQPIDASLLDVSITRGGVPVLLWHDGALLSSARWPPAGAAQPASEGVPLNGAGDGAIARDGSLAAIDVDAGLRAVTRRTAGAWSPFVTLAAEKPDEAALGALPQGAALVAWEDGVAFPSPQHFARVRAGRVEARRTLAGADDETLLLSRDAGRVAYGRFTLDRIVAATATRTGPLPVPRLVARSAKGPIRTADIAAMPHGVAAAWGDERGVHLVSR